MKGSKLSQRIPKKHMSSCGCCGYRQLCI